MVFRLVCGIHSECCLRVKMEFSVVCALLCLTVFAGVNAQYPEEDGVLILTKETFEKATQDFNNLLVEFCEYA